MKSNKSTPLKTQKTAASQYISLAEEFIQGRDPNTAEISDLPILIKSLQALRHKSMISDDLKRQKMCEYLISEFTLKQENRSSNITRKTNKTLTETPKKSMSKSSLIDPNGAISEDFGENIELSDEELTEMNKIVDQLLDGSEIDSIGNEIIPKLKYALKLRKKLCVSDGDYSHAKMIDDHLSMISIIECKRSESDKISVTNMQMQKKQQLLEESQIKLKNSEKAISKLQNELNEEISKIGEKEEKAQSEIFKQIEDETLQLEEELSEIDLGFNFKPSKKLIRMRSLENHLATRSFFEEAAEQRKLADKLEIEERKQYDVQARQALNRKEKKQKAQHQQKIQKCNDYWKSVRDKTTEKYQIRIRAKESEIKSTKQLIAKLEADDANSKLNDTLPLEEENQQNENNFEEEQNENPFTEEEQQQNEKLITEEEEPQQNENEKKENEENTEIIENTVENNEEEMINEENTETMSAILPNVTSPISGIASQNEDQNENLCQTLQPQSKSMPPKSKPQRNIKSNSNAENVEDETDANIDDQTLHEEANNAPEVADDQSQKSVESDVNKTTKPRKVVKKKIVKKVVKKVASKATE